MNVSLSINGKPYAATVNPGDSLLKVLRQLGFYAIKFGDEHGQTGADTVLLDGQPVNAGLWLAAQAVGHSVVTLEAFGQHPQQGWKESSGLTVLQQEFVSCGAIQCGYCTPAMLLSAQALLDEIPSPSEDQIRQALSGVLCRCTGYLKPVWAVMRAAARLRGEIPEQNVSPQIFSVDDVQPGQSVGKSPHKVDALKLALGRPAFSDDLHLPDMLYAKILHSPVAHARIKCIDASKARALPGVAAVLTYQDIPRVAYSTAGQSDPVPGPQDSFSLDEKVRFVGDRVAFVAAETPEIAEQALQLIEVEYQELPALLDPQQAMQPGAPILHDEPEYINFADSDPARNLAAQIRIDIGDVEDGFSQADQIFEAEYTVSKVQQAHIEPHVAITYWDEDDRLVIRTSTQVPFHVRRLLAPVLELPVKRIRVIKPRIGGGFGGKQEVLVEDVAAHLTIATGRPVRIEYTREEEFTASRSRHPMRIRMKTGVKKDGTITANQMLCLTDTGANGAHALTVTGNTGHKAMALYVGDGQYRKQPNIRFYADIVYTNHPPAGAFRGYGVPQGFWAVERQMEKIARSLGMDPLEFRLKNALRSGELHPFSTAWSEGREPRPETIETNGLEECVRRGKEAIGWEDKFGNPVWHSLPDKPHLRKGIGVALVMQGTAIPYLDMGGASLKINDDGSFNLLIGATDLGTGSDTVLAQMAAEVLGVPVEDIIVYSSDTDFTPFDKGAYASSTTYISGAAVARAAEQVAAQIKKRAARMFQDSGLQIDPQTVQLSGGNALAPNGACLSLAEIALNALHHNEQEQIMAVASYYSPVSPPPFAAQFAEITVDVETGALVVDNLVMAVDSGVIVNPVTASGQIEGGMAQALGYAVCEEMTYDDQGRPLQTDFRDYHVFRAHEMPGLTAIFVQTDEPSHPFGVKAVAEIPMDGVAPAVANALADALDVDVDSLPVTPEKVWQAQQKGNTDDR